MRNLSFSLHQIRQAIRVQGKEYTFLRDVLNSFNEPTGESTHVATARGLWHTSSGYVSMQTSEGSRVRSKQAPQILALLQDVKGVKQGDFVLLDNIRYNVNGVDSLGDLGVIADISLEAAV